MLDMICHIDRSEINNGASALVSVCRFESCVLALFAGTLAVSEFVKAFACPVRGFHCRSSLAVD